MAAERKVRSQNLPGFERKRPEVRKQGGVIGKLEEVEVAEVGPATLVYSVKGQRREAIISRVEALGLQNTQEQAEGKDVRFLALKITPYRLLVIDAEYKRPPKARYVQGWLRTYVFNRDDEIFNGVFIRREEGKIKSFRFMVWSRGKVLSLHSLYFSNYLSTFNLKEPDVLSGYEGKKASWGARLRERPPKIV